MDCEVTVQIFSGGFLEETISFETVERKLLSVLPKLPVTKVLMGWVPEKTLYEKTAKFLAERNIDFYLWFPVFSETGALEDLSPLVDFQGQRIECRKDEGFSFCCPSPQNTEKILGIFEREFASVKFNGVFLDRIRYPSFANHGFGGVFSCFCPECREAFKSKSFNIEQLKAALSSITAADTPLGITEYRGGGEYVFKDSALSDFFNMKAEIISERLRQICGYFRERGYGIGFDVFAPFLSPFVGQDLKTLSGLCDFIKPMMYRITHAPAGLPFETEAFLQQTVCADAVKKQNFYKLLGIDPELQGAESKSFTFKKKPFDLAFTVKELQNLSSLSACPVYAGVEINRVKDIAESDRGYIEETVKAYAQTGIRGFALSWNLLDMPDENAAQAADSIKRLSLI